MAELQQLTTSEKQFLKAFGLVTGFCLVLFLIRILFTGQLDFFFIPGNLTLAWLALFFGWLLIKQLKTHPWSSWQAVALTFAWLVFLPNSWYVLTDFIHVYPSGAISELFDVIMISSLAMVGLGLGFTSLYLVHREVLKRLSTRLSWLVIMAIILLSSFAIYLGRDLRWNTWDVIANPGGLIINVSDRFIDPFGHPRALNVTVLFFVLLSVVYVALWQFLKPAGGRKSPLQSDQ